MRILLVDDETELTDPLSHVLSYEGYTVDVANNGLKGYELALENTYDLLILDWMLPYQSGLDLCRSLRSQGNSTPVLFLTAKDTLDDRVMGLDAGGDDYLVKPFELRELLARVRALLRRSVSVDHKPSSDRLRVGDLEFDSENRAAYRQGRMINLSEKESELLAYFMTFPGQLLTHQQIYDHLWGDSEQHNSNVLAALVRLLRRKIEENGETTLIHTVYGKGYRFSEKS